MPKHLVSRDLIPFRERNKRSNGYRLPKIETEREDDIREQLEPDLEPEEETFVLHYLRYADLLLASSEAAQMNDADSNVPENNVPENNVPENNVPENNNVVELPGRENKKKAA
jgi:hypothetical protein